MDCYSTHIGQFQRKTPLHRAAAGGHLHVVEYLVSQKADINIKDDENNTPLHGAAARGHLHVVEYLVSQKADINIKDENDETPLHKAADNGRLPVVKYLVSQKAYIDIKNKGKRTPLHKAVLYGHLPVVEYLVSQKADIDIQDNERKTPLHKAAARGHLHGVEYLVSQKADIKIKDNNGETPLHNAATNGHLPVVKCLVSQKADIDIKNIWGLTALHMAARKGVFGIVEYLLSHNADIEARDNKGSTALHIATREGKFDIVEYLLSHNADTEARDNEGSTVLHIATRGGKFDIVEYLLSHNADIEARDNEDNTPLHRCVLCYFTSEETATTLVKYGADFLARNKKGKTPFDIAKRRKLKEILRIFKRELEIGLPKEMRYLRVEDADYFKDALRSGFYHSYLGKIMLVGNEGVGKTAITAIIIGRKPSKKRIATEGIDVHISRAAVDLDSRKLIPKNLSVKEVAYRNLVMRKRYGATSADTSDILIDEDDDDDENNADSVIPVIVVKDEVDDSIKPLGKMQDDVLNIDGANATVAEKTERTKELSFFRKFLPKPKEKPDKITTDMLKEGIVKIGKKGLHDKNLAPVIILDFAGQRVFYSTHQSFLTHRGIYVLTVNGSLLLDDEMKTESPIPGKFGKRTTRAYIEFWISSILTYSKGRDKKFPKILVVCTHKDLVPVEKVAEQRSYIYGEIAKMFDGTPEMKHLVLDHQIFVNAMNPKDPELEVLKDVLVDIMFSQPSWGEKVPKPWINLEMVINQKIENGETVLSRRQLEEINQENPIQILSDKALDIFLKVHHSQGDIIYFPLPGLRDYIIIQPAYIVDALKSIVTETRFCDGRRLSMVNTMNTDGIVKKDDLQAILQAEKFDRHQGHLTNLMSHLDILAEPRTYNRDTGKLLTTDFFYIPSLMIKEDETRFTQQDNLYKKTLGLSFLFHSTVLPSAIGFRFISSIVAMFDVHCYESQRMLFSGMVVVDINSSLSMLVQVKKQRVDIFLIHEISKSNIINDIASRIRTCLEDTLHRISDSYKISSAGPDAGIETAPFHMEYACSQIESPCYAQHIENWVCDVHGEDLEVAMTKWFSDRTTDECPIDCPGVAELALEEAPNDLHLAKLVLQISCDDFIPILLRLRMTDKEIRAIQEDYKGNVLNIMFISFRKWRMKYSNGTLKHLSDALKEPESQEYVHALCKVFRDKPLESKYDYLEHVEPNDEYLDRLATQAIDESLLLTVQLLNDAAYWLQLKEDIRNSVEINRKMLRKWRDDTRGKKSMRELGQACNNVGIHISLIL